MKRFHSHPVITALFIGSLAVAAGTALWAHLVFRNIAGPIVVHFNGREGITRIGTVADLDRMLAFEVALIAANALVAFGLPDKEALVRATVAGATIAMSLLIFIGFAAIISVN